MELSDPKRIFNEYLGLNSAPRQDPRDTANERLPEDTGTDLDKDKNQKLARDLDPEQPIVIDDCAFELTIPEMGGKVKKITEQHQNIRLRLDLLKGIEDGVDAEVETLDGSEDDGESDGGEPKPSSSTSYAMEGQSCTSENWMSFISWKTRRRGSEKLRDSKAAKFTANTSADSTSKPITLVKIEHEDHQYGAYELSINSLYLRNQLRKVIEIERYPSFEIAPSKITLYDEWIILYQHINELKDSVMRDTSATENDRQDMMSLFYFVTKGFRSKIYEDIRDQISQGFITYGDVWALFKVGNLMVMTDPVGGYDIAKVESVHILAAGIDRVEPWAVKLGKYSWELGAVRKFEYNNRITPFRNSRVSKKITDLDCFPLSYHENCQAIRASAIERGKSWIRYCERGPTVMTYEGIALPMIGGSTQSRARGEPSDFNYKVRKFSSTVIVDPEGLNKSIQQAITDGRSFFDSPYSSPADDTRMNKEKPEKFSEEDFMICPSIFPVYSLDDHDWYLVDIAGLKEKVWRPQCFDRLVLDSAKKDTLARLAKTNSEMAQKNKLEDIIEGKGLGTVLLLYGPPGVGKTLTAEVLSEYTGRPLLKVNLGKLAGHPRWERVLEQTFTNAKDWNAILLIDEAEIVLEKRAYEQMQQNSWISVFLRKLEYSDGLLILTTNLMDTIDEAFQSRISYPVKFPDLCLHDRHRIWSDFISNMKMLDSYKKELLKYVDDWSKYDINGRQIRNIILMAESLAASDEEHPLLTPKHIEDLLNTTIEFCANSKGNPGKADKINLRSSGPTY